jgi:hypothetical protein
MLGVAMSMTREGLSQKIADTERLLSRSPTPQSIARRAVLAVLDGKPDVASWHLRRLDLFFPRASGELVSQMRAMAEQRPDELGQLSELLDAISKTKPRSERSES